MSLFPWSFVLGAIFGSFANVVIHRFPKGESLWTPPSRCPQCLKTLRWYDNIPIVSYLVLRARCRSCKTPISARYFIIEIVTGLVFASLAARLDLTPELPAFLLMGLVLVVLSGIDMEHMRIPNKVTGLASVAGAALLGGAAIVVAKPERLATILIGAAAYSLPMLALALALPGKMGLGDVKLAAYLGGHLAWFGLLTVLVGAMLGFFIGSVIGVTLIALGLKSRKSAIPFGPSMCAGTLLAVLFGTGIIRIWLP